MQLSGHALKRLEQRQIGLADDQLDRLRKAMDTLASRGSRQSLVMLDQVAYVVHVPSSTVVTAVAPDAGKESVFTQIDSVVIA
jgi:flagellar operon protein